MLYYIIIIFLFFVIFIIYSLLISKSKNLVNVSEKLNKSMGEYFILLSEYEKIIKEEDQNVKLNKVDKLLVSAKEYCNKFNNSNYKKDIEKLILKLEEMKKN